MPEVKLQLMTRVYIEMTTNTVHCGKIGRHSCRFPSRNQNSAEGGVAPAPGWGGGWGGVGVGVGGGGGTGAASTSAMGKVLV